MLKPGVERDELVAIVALLRTRLLGPSRLVPTIEHIGSAAALLNEVLEGKVPPTATRLPALVDATLALKEAYLQVEAWEEQRLDVRTIFSPLYPSNLQSVGDKPPFLFVEGRFQDVEDRRAVAVVGTRQASPAGIARARRLSQNLVEGGVTVVSGMARGIDMAAHLAALDAGGRTVAVMGTGILHRYPRECSPLADRIVVSGGALVSQFLPTQTPTRWTFPTRNITMSGLALATIVVEAGETSGAKQQAEAALRHGRSVFLIRSLVEERDWAKALIDVGQDGSRATLVKSAEDILSRIDLVLDDAVPM